MMDRYWFVMQNLFLGYKINYNAKIKQNRDLETILINSLGDLTLEKLGVWEGFSKILGAQHAC